MASATIGAPAQRAAPNRVGFLGTLASEWTKLWSVRSTYITVILSLVLTLGSTALIATVIGNTWDDWSVADKASFDPILTSFSGSIFIAVLFTVLAVGVISTEYSTGMIRLSLTATPQRGRFLLAKVAVVSIVTLVLGSILALGMFLIGQAIFGSYDLPTVSWGDADVVRTLVAMGLTSPVWAIITVAIAVLLRSTVGAVTSVLGLIFAPAIIGAFLPTWWQENVLAYLIGPASDSIVIGHLDEDSSMYLDLPVAIVVVAIWMVASIGIAYAVLKRRDA